jgi:hypothetical protein
MFPVLNEQTSYANGFGNGQDPGKTQRAQASAFLCVDSFDRNQTAEEAQVVRQPINNFVLTKRQPFVSGYFNRIGLTELRFPFSTPNINARNNKIVFLDASNVSFTITVPEGFYTPSELATELDNQLTTDISGQTWAVTYEDTEASFQIVSNANFVVQPFNYGTKRTLRGLFYMLNGQTLAPATTWISSPMPNMAYTQYVDVVSRTLTQFQTTKDNSTRDNQVTAIIARIYLNNYSSEGVGQGDATAGIYWSGCRPALVYRFYNVPKYSSWSPGQFIDQIDIQLLDDCGELLYYGAPGLAQFSNNDFQLTFHCSEN